MRKTILALVVLAFAGAVAVADDPPKRDKQPGDKTNKANLEGTYTIVSGEKDGKAVPKEEIDGSVVVFTGTTIMGTDKDKKEFFSATYTLDTSKKPAVINMTSKLPGKDGKPKEEAAAGLVKWDADTVTLVYSLPGGKTPTEFKAGEKQHLFVLKKKAAK